MYIHIYICICIYIYSHSTASWSTVSTLVFGVSHRQTDTHSDTQVDKYGVATISRLLKIIGLFCKRAL